MGKQEQMTPDTASDTAGELAPGPGSGRPDRGLRAWFRTRSRGARLVLTSTAALTAVVVALLALSATSGGPPKAAAPPPRTAPAFSLAVLGHPGQHLSLASYAGHPLILNFFASWCAPCQRETPLIARFYRAEQHRVTILGVDANDSASKAVTFTRKAGVSYPVVSDPAPMTTTLTYGVPALPATFFLNARHQIVQSVYGAVTLAELKSGVAMMTSASGRS